MKQDRWTNKEILSVLEITIKEDDETKLILLHAMILNYTIEDQLNVAINAASSTGKSYIANEVAKYFPQEDVRVIGYATPQSFFYEHGRVVDENGKDIPTKSEYVKKGLEKWVEKNPEETERGGITEWKNKRTAEDRRLKTEYDNMKKTRLVDLHQLIILFVDQPHEELLKRVRPLLSHDRKIITSKHVNRVGGGGYQTLTVTLQGYPTIIFCSAMYLRDEQEQTRVILLSPDTSQKKQEEAIKLGSIALSDRDAFRKTIEEDPQRKELIKHIRRIKRMKINQIVIPPKLMNLIRDHFLEKTLQPRNQRDFKYVTALAKSHCLLNYNNRTKKGKTLYANKKDITSALEMYASIEESNEMGVPPEAYRFYIDVVKGQCRNPVSYSVLKQRYRIHYGRSIDHYRLLQIIDALVAAGLIEKDIRHPDDLRVKCIREIDQVNNL
jgi:hypothetical protein